MFQNPRQGCSLPPLECRCFKNNYKLLNLHVKQQQKGAGTCREGGSAGSPEDTSNCLSALTFINNLFPATCAQNNNFLPEISTLVPGGCQGLAFPGPSRPVGKGSGSPEGQLWRDLPLVGRGTRNKHGASVQLIALGALAAAAAATQLSADAAIRAFGQTPRQREWVGLETSAAAEGCRALL